MPLCTGTAPSPDSRHAEETMSLDVVKWDRTVVVNGPTEQTVSAAARMRALATSLLGP